MGHIHEVGDKYPLGTVAIDIGNKEPVDFDDVYPGFVEDLEAAETGAEVVEGDLYSPLPQER